MQGGALRTRVGKHWIGFTNYPTDLIVIASLKENNDVLSGASELREQREKETWLNSTKV